MSYVMHPHRLWRYVVVKSVASKIVLHRIKLTGANDIGVENQEICGRRVDDRNVYYEYTVTLGYQTLKKYKARVQW